MKKTPDECRGVTMWNMAGVTVGIITAVACSCMPRVAAVPYTLCEDYKSANLSDRMLVLALPEDKNIFIENPKDVVDDYGGMNAPPQSRIKKFYFPIFSETLKSYISGDSMVTADTDRPDFIYKDLKKRQVVEKTANDTGSLVFSIPQKSEMQTAGLDSAVLVLIDRITFRRNNFYIEYYWDDKTKRPANLEANVRVLIWDYKNDMPVFYGTLTQKIEFQIAMQRKHWDESARSLAKKIVVSAKCL